MKLYLRSDDDATASSSAAASSSGDSDSHTGMWVGIAIGLVAFIGGVCLLIRFRNNKKAKEANTSRDTEDDGGKAKDGD